MMKTLITFFCTILLSACSSTAPKDSTKTDTVQIYDAAAQKIVSPNAKVEVLATGYKWTEGPVWSRNGYLLFSDIPNNSVEKYTPGKGAQSYLKPSGATAIKPHDDKGGSDGLLIDNNGHLILFQHGDRRVAMMQSSLNNPKASFSTLAGQYHGKRLNSPNDGVMGKDGTLYFTDPPYGLARGQQDPRKVLAFNGIFALSPQGKLSLLDDSVSFPNGIALSPDNKTLFVSVSDKQRPVWLAYDINANGTLSHKRLILDSRTIANAGSGVPDGMAVNANGDIFSAGPGGIWLFTPKGKLLAIIHTQQVTTNCTLDAKEHYLYITTPSTLLRIKLQASSAKG